SAVGAPPSLSWVVVSSLISVMLLPGRSRLRLDLDLECQVHHRSQRRRDRAVFLLRERECFRRLGRIDAAARDVLHGDLPEPPGWLGVLDRLHACLELLQVLPLLVKDVDDVVGGACRQRDRQQVARLRAFAVHVCVDRNVAPARVARREPEMLVPDELRGAHDLGELETNGGRTTSACPIFPRTSTSTTSPSAAVSGSTYASAMPIRSV